MSKHTPRPWVLVPESWAKNGSYLEPCITTIANEHTGMAQQIATIRVGIPGTAANGRLIRVAPDLLEACKLLIEFKDNPARLSFAQQFARQIIAEAERA